MHKLDLILPDYVNKRPTVVVNVSSEHLQVEIKALVLYIDRYHGLNFVESE